MSTVPAAEKDSSGASLPEELACKNPPAGSYQQISCLDGVIRCALPAPSPRSGSGSLVLGYMKPFRPPQVPGELQRGRHPEEEVRVPRAPPHAQGQRQAQGHGQPGAAFRRCVSVCAANRATVRVLSGGIRAWEGLEPPSSSRRKSERLQRHRMGAWAGC